jgi:hypothetical protein
MTSQERDAPGGVGQTIIGDTKARERLTTSILELADRADAEKAEVQARAEPVIVAARLVLGDGDRRTAAALLDWVAAQFRGRSFIAVAEDYERQAKECRRRRTTGK